ncbi:hypothetical protein DYB30_010959 [Aphanomyces astaci]|uniref:Uncharacterized protein n=1 Tax=Aphanomyces astaci TaxID=112090 RepID=A0A397C866_APHAT|nr:hypothetical protein DYB30_010959 [Aphanomyces astaci]RHY77713.1 hypothetical protein DYB38_009281 [Aphanomyces astaci]
MLGCCRCLERGLRCFVACAAFVNACLSWVSACFLYPYTCLHNWRQDRSLQLKTHHEWYFLLWRCTFPLLTLLLVVGVSALGRLGGVVGYALSAGPVWFYCMLIVLATPFLLMFRFPNFHPGMVTTFWKVLFLCSAFISVIEVFVWTGGKSQYAHHHHHHGSSMMGQRKLSWLLGNLLFGIVGFIGVPFFFSLQPRVRIDSSEVQDDAAAALVSLPTSPSGIVILPQTLAAFCADSPKSIY